MKHPHLHDERRLIHQILYAARDGKLYEIDAMGEESDTTAKQPDNTRELRSSPNVNMKV
jgi:hypothetical protein